MKFLGLTGGIACGKSAVSNIFRNCGISVIDTDAICHQIYEHPDLELSGLLSELAGCNILASDGSVDRRKLSEAVFQNQEKLQKLNEIVHPRIDVAVQLESMKLSAGKFAVMDVPLLFETGWNKKVWKTCAVWAPEELQMRRMMERGFTRMEAEKRIASQLSAFEKLERADYGLISGGAMIRLEIQVGCLIEELNKTI